MITFNGLPLYRVALGSQDGVVRVSLVDDPAVESNFDVFAKQGEKAPALYAVQDEDRHLVRGVVLRADWPIYRKDKEDPQGYYVTFGKDVIRQIAERYLSDGFQNRVDTAHDGQEIDDVQMVQFFIKDTAAGIDPEGFENIADGSLFAEYHVTNEDVWAEIKAGTFKGFSVEIFYSLIPVTDTMSGQEADAGAAASLFVKLLSKINDMRTLKEIRTALARALAAFGSVTTDKGVIHWDGDEDLKAGDRVYVEDEEGNRTAAEDGEYVTADGKTVVVVEGAVSEIRDPKAEVAPQGSEENDEAPAQMAAQRRAKFEESYDEKKRKIADAIREARGNREDDYGYLVSAGDDFGVWAWYNAETNWEDRFVRYVIAWDEAGNATASDPVECRMAFVPMDFDDIAAFKGPAAAEEAPTGEEFDAAVARAEELRTEVKTLRARVAELEKTPAAKPVKETYNAKEAGALVSESTGDRGLDRLARYNRK